MTAPAQRRASGDRGGVTTELVLLTPLLLVMLLFIVFAGRMATARGRVINASRDAARAASIARSPSAAEQAAHEAAEATLADKSITCRPLVVDPDVRRFEPGGEVSVTVRCTIELGDLTLLEIPGERSFESTSVEVIDTFRGAG